MPQSTLPPEHLYSLFYALTDHFPGWSITVGDGYGGYYASFARDDGALFTLQQLKYADPGRLRVYGFYLVAPKRSGVISYSAKTPEISISHRRPPQAIARDIHRRFLGDYVRIFLACFEAKRQEDEKRERGKQSFASLSAVFAATSYPARVDEGANDARLHWYGSDDNRLFHLQLDSCYFSETVMVELRNVPIPIARQLLETLKENILPNTN